MTTLHATNAYNVISTLNRHLNTTLKAITLPAGLPSFTIIYTLPEAGVPTPSISVHHRALYDNDQFQGRRVSNTEAGWTSHYICELNAWVSRGQSNWLVQKNTLQAMLHHVALNTTVLPIYNFASPTNPTVTTYKINMRGLEGLEVAPDPNPDIERARFLWRYDWTQRS